MLSPRLPGRFRVHLTRRGASEADDDSRWRMAHPQVKNSRRFGQEVSNLGSAQSSGGPDRLHYTVPLNLMLKAEAGPN
ncbi:hypothetical protein TCAL_15998 [Tigriopus californicus]|uniref:Uncharacterized protein n=1 Tax=Tigriopus californicus TaxID=6832 RepID=A0A553PHL1_TIGCA|nr:hypothetical protein TCAL_15998 [Tigriopus californicus]